MPVASERAAPDTRWVQSALLGEGQALLGGAELKMSFVGVRQHRIAPGTVGGFLFLETLQIKQAFPHDANLAQSHLPWGAGSGAIRIINDPVNCLWPRTERCLTMGGCETPSQFAGGKPFGLTGEGPLSGPCSASPRR
ncbi:hypothetical protein NBRC116594_12200 [Shimia sp. NS0008-38b]